MLRRKMAAVAVQDCPKVSTAPSPFIENGGEGEISSHPHACQRAPSKSAALAWTFGARVGFKSSPVTVDGLL